MTPPYNHANGRIVIEMTESLGDGEQLFTRARRGTFGVLDCAGYREAGRSRYRLASTKRFPLMISDDPEAQ